MFTIIIVIGVAVVSLLGGYFLRKFIAEQKIHDAETQAKYVIEQAKKEAADRHRAAELEAKIFYTGCARISNNKPRIEGRKSQV